MTTFSRIRESINLGYPVVKIYDGAGTYLTDRIAIRGVGDTKKMSDNFVKGDKFIPHVVNVNPVSHSSSVTITSEPSNHYTYVKRTVGDVVERNLVGCPLMLAVSENVLLSSYMTPPPFSTDMANKVSLNAKAALNSPEIDLGVNLIEVGQTLSMLINPIAGLAKLGKKFLTKDGIRIKNPGTKKAVKYLEDKWLEYRYGWKPLASDFEQAFDTYYSRSLPEICGVRGKHISSDTTTKLDSSLTESYYGYAFTYRKITHERVTYRSKLYYTVSDREQFARLKLGLSSANLLNTVWEEVPYSFVVDWWFNIGDWLKAIAPNPSVTQLGFCMSATQEREILYAMKNFGSAAWYKPVPYPDWVEIKTRTYERWKVPVVQFVVPSFDAGFSSWKHLVDGLAMSHQQLKFR